MGLVLEGWLVWILPLTLSFVAFLVSKVNRIASHIVAIASPFSSLVCAILLLNKVLSGTFPLPFEQSIGWLAGQGLYIELGILLDQLSLIMLLVVAFISTLIFIFSVDYMREEQDIGRYWFWMCFFIGSMQMLIISNNFIQMLMGWEMVGLCSWALISFWYKSRAPSPEPGFLTEGEYNAHCGLKALVTTSFADLFFIAAIAMVAWATYLATGNATFNFIKLSENFSWIGVLNTAGILPIFALFLLSGSLGKSAQFPFNEWLPEAMAGPTTVSALIHAATMVKAGCYFVARFFTIVWEALPVYPEIKIFFWLALGLGAFTAFLAATQGMVAKELKKVLAFSTISQLGYIFVALGAAGVLLSWEAFIAGILHIVSHAIFKALLFLCAGAILHVTHTKYMNEMGGLKGVMPITYSTMLIGAFSLSGIPPFSGFFSKDEILSTVVGLNWIVYAILALTVALTTFYTFRMIGIVFFGEKSQHVIKLEEEGKKLHEVGPLMIIPLTILAFLALFIWLFYPNMTGFLVGYDEALHIDLLSFLSKTFTSPLLMVSIVMVIVGLYPAYKVYITRVILPEKITVPKLYNLLYNRWYWNHVYYWLAEKVKLFAERIRYIQTGVSNVNVAYVVTGAIVFIIILIIL